MNLYEQFSTDQDAERKGTDITIGDATFTIARSGGQNKAYEKALEQKTRKYRRGNELVALPEKQSMDIVRLVYAETIVLGWSVVTDREGKEMPYSIQNCVRLFTDLPDLFDHLRRAAGDIATFQNAVREEEAGN